MGPDTVIDWKAVRAFVKDCLWTFFKAALGKLMVTAVLAILGALLLGIAAFFGA